MRIVYFLLGIATTNSWLKYRRSLPQSEDRPGKRLSLKDFVISIAQSLAKVRKPLSLESRKSLAFCGAIRKRKPNETHPSDELRSDGIGHLPIHADKGRCKHCIDENARSRWKCAKCQIHLCLNANKNCFFAHHISNSSE